jgi:phosphoribosylformimino-5-aminoimidazole carboxamide ribotide isomerase
MLIIPAIDIKDGYCVRLVQGNKENKEIFSKDPCAVARKWEEQGAKLLHVVDLDGAFQGIPVHSSLIKKIAQSVNIPIQVGGGIRDKETISNYLNFGIERVVLGTFLLNQGSDQMKFIAQQFGDSIIAGIDIRKNHLAIEGWVKEVNQPVDKFVAYLSEIGIKRIIYTDINRDGMLIGPNLHMIQKILQENQVKLIASGGISTLDNLYQLQQLQSLGLEGAIVGKALYKGLIKLEEAVHIFQD